MLSKNTGKIHFYFLTSPFHLPNRTGLKDFIAALLKKEGKSIEAINYIFCYDEYLLELNKTHLKHNTLTDIITFELSEKQQALVADIYISIERVKENATLFQSTFKSELHRVIFHGVLHLSGYKDKSKEQAQLMRLKEDEYLDRYFVPRGTMK